MKKFLIIAVPLNLVADLFFENMLSYPQYTRPRNFEGMEVPEVLLGGNHAEI